MTANTYLDIDSTTSLPKRMTATDEGGTGHENVIVQTDATGRLANSLMPVGLAAEVVTCNASENLASGDLVNLWSDSGTLKARKADASAANAGKKADGFTLEAVDQDNPAAVHLEGDITGLTTLTIGATYYLSGSTAGAITATAPSTSGYLLQSIGKAVSATELTFEPDAICIL